MTMPHSPAHDSGRTADSLLRLIGEELDGCAGIKAEFSLVLRPGAITDRGRFCIWLAGSPEGLRRFFRLLVRLAVPPPTRAAMVAGQVVCVGLGVAVGASGTELRLYRHSLQPGTLKASYDNWRWRYGHHAADWLRRHRYEFHFMPETPDGRRPLELIDRVFRPVFARLMADERFRCGSGFWLRINAAGTIGEIDLALPWHPLLGDLPGLASLGRQLNLKPATLSPWHDLPIRHVAVKGEASVTLYASAPLNGLWPASEAALQAGVRETALTLHQGVLAISGKASGSLLPRPPDAALACDLDRFYGGDVALWRQVLGEMLHYHNGLFLTDGLQPTDAEMDAALRRAVTGLFPWIPAGSTVYDIGCGWGGPLALLARERGCRGLGLTISRGQFRHVAALGLPVRLGDAERTLPPGSFDCALLLESFCHISDKAGLLRKLRQFAGRLVMRVNCQDAAPSGIRFGGSMSLVSSGALRRLLADSGWTIGAWRDCRPLSLPSVMVWERRLRGLAPTGDPHLEVLRNWSTRVAAMPQAWAANNPLIEVVAD